MRPGRRFPLLACLIAVFALADTSGQAGAASWPSNVRVNQDQSGNPQAETSLAVDPNDPLHLVAVWWEVTAITADSRDKRLNYGWTRDGGQTWQSRRLETDIYSSDPAIVADSQGNFYIETAMGDPFEAFPTENQVGIFKSTDGGETFVELAPIRVGDYDK